MNTAYADIVFAVREGVLTPGDREALVEFLISTAVTVERAETAPLPPLDMEDAYAAVGWENIRGAWERFAAAINRTGVSS